MVQKNSVAKDKIVVLSGATASGKTSLSIELAKMLDGEIISADSMQVYKRLNIGTAKATVEEMQGIKHHLIDILEPTETFTVKTFVTLAKEAVSDVISRGKVPIVIGGTGFYIDALLKEKSLGGFDKNETLREELRKTHLEMGNSHMYELLKSVDCLSAEKISVNDSYRILRALEIFYATGKPKSFFDDSEKQYVYDFIIAGIDVGRDELYARINNRVDKMINDGLILEVKELLASGVSESCQAMQGIGYKELMPYIKGETTLNDAVIKIKQFSRNYAKRQLTWHRKNIDFVWLDSSLDAKSMAKIIADKFNAL